MGKLLIATLAITLLFGIETVDAKNSQLVESIDSIMTSLYANDSPGAALLIADGDEILFDKGYGIADMKTRKAIDGNTVFNIASISKQFTTSSILKLQEMGELSISDCVSKYFPEYSGQMWQKVQLKHLMSQSSGVPDLRPRNDRDYMLYCTDEQSMEYFAILDTLKFTPGSCYDYINPTFLLLSEVIHRISGQEFVEFQSENIFKPARMTSTCYFSPDAEIYNMAHGYVVNGDNDTDALDSDSNKTREASDNYYTDSRNMQWTECDYGEETFFATRPDGGIYSSTHDMLRWEQFLSSSAYIGKESLHEAYSPQVKVTGSPYSTYQNRENTYYGYGWFIDKSPNRKIKIYHTGDNGGFQAYVAKYIDSSVVVIFLSNRNDVDRWALQQQIENMLIKYNHL